MDLNTNRRPFPEPYIAHPTRSPVKTPPSRFASQSSLRDSFPNPRALLNSSFNVPSIRDPFQVPSGLLWREMPVFRAFLYTSSRFPRRAPSERCPNPRALLNLSFNVPSIRDPFQVPSSLLWREMSVFRASLYASSMVPKYKPPLQFRLTQLPRRETLHF